MAQTPQQGAVGAPRQLQAPADNEAAKARAEMAAERSRDFAAYLQFLIDDSRNGRTKLTEAKDKKKGWIDKKDGGSRGGKSGAVDTKSARNDGSNDPTARADRAIDGAAKDLIKLGSIEPGADRAFKEITQLL